MDNGAPKKARRPQNKLWMTIKRTFVEGFKRFGSNFLLTVNLKAAFSLLLPFLRNLINNPRALLDLNWLSESNIELRVNAIRYGLFVGGFTGIFQIVRDLLAIWRHYRNEQVKPAVQKGLTDQVKPAVQKGLTDQVKPAVQKGLTDLAQQGSLDSGLDTFVAGSVAGLAFLAIPSEGRRTIALYICMRAAQCVFNLFKLRGWFTGSDRKLLANYFWAHWDSLLFTLASAQVMYAYVMRPGTLPPAYWNFIVRTGPVHRRLLQAVRETCRGLPVDLESLQKYLDASAYKGPPIKATDTMMPGAAFHPNISASTAVVMCFIKTWKLGFPMYLALTIVPTLVLHFKDLVKEPKLLLRPVTSGARSAVFLGAFVAVYYAFALSYRSFMRVDNRFMYYLGGWVCGWSVLLEKKSRRAELAMYVLPRAADSLYQIMVEHRWMASVPFGEVLIFGLSMGVMLHCYYHRKGTVNPLIRRILKRLFDEKPKNIFSTGKRAKLTRSYSSHWLDALLNQETIVNQDSSESK